MGGAAATGLDWDSVTQTFTNTDIIDSTPGVSSGNYDLATLFTDISLDENGILDFQGQRLTINISGALTFPSNIKGIKNASSISLTAASIAGISGGDFSLVSNGALTLGLASIDIGANDLTLTAGSGAALSFTGATTTLAARDIVIGGASVATANGNNLTLTAARNLDLGGIAYNLGTGSTGGALSLTYAGTLTAPLAPSNNSREPFYYK